MTVRTAISVLVLLTAAAQAQQSAVTTINSARNNLKAAVAPVQAKRDAALRATTPGSAMTASIPSRLPEKPKQPAALAPNTAPEAQQSGKPIEIRGKRDPFVSIIRNGSTGGGTCTTGKKCLVIGQIELKGIVRTATETIAVVQNSQNKTYFLRENDPVFNGKLVKIQPDQVVFRETVVDRAGRQSSRDIIKRMLKPAV